MSKKYDRPRYRKPQERHLWTVTRDDELLEMYLHPKPGARGLRAIMAKMGLSESGVRSRLYKLARGYRWHDGRKPVDYLGRRCRTWREGTPYTTRDGDMALLAAKWAHKNERNWIHNLANLLQRDAKTLRNWLVRRVSPPTFFGKPVFTDQELANELIRLSRH